MEPIVQSGNQVPAVKLQPSELEEIRLETEFAGELSLLRKEMLSPRPQAIRNILNAFKEKAMPDERVPFI